MTFNRLLILHPTHAPVRQAAHLRRAGMLTIQARTSNRVPDVENAALWVKTSDATRLHNAGVPLGLLSPGPSWLSTVPGHFLGRKVLCTTVGALPGGWAGPGVFRLAEQDFGSLGHEKTYAESRLFIEQVLRYHSRYADLVADAHVIASAPVEYTDRYRIFVADGKVTASTRFPAVQDAAARYGLGPAGPDNTLAAEYFARQVLDATAWHQPPGFRIDVGTAADGSFQLISAGPSWASEFNEANPSGVLTSILAGQSPGSDQWKWVPDELFQRVIFPSWPAAV